MGRAHCLDGTRLDVYNCSKVVSAGGILGMQVNLNPFSLLHITVLGIVITRAVLYYTAIHCLYPFPTSEGFSTMIS
jgi:hypothetical protein